MSQFNMDSSCSTDVQLFSRVVPRRGVRSSDFSSKIHSIITEQAKSWQEAKQSVDIELDSLKSKLAMAKELTEQQKRKITNLLIQKEMLQSRLDDEIRKREHTLNQLTRAVKTHDRYKTQLTLLDSEIQKLQHRVQTVCQNAAQQREEMEDIKKQYRNLEAAYEAKKEDARALNVSLQETQQLSLARNRETEQNLAVCKEKLEESKQENLRLEKQVMDALSKQQLLESADKQRDLAFAELTARNESLLKSLEDAKLAREREVARVQQELTAEVNQRQLALDAKEDELSRCKEISETAKNELILFQGQCEQLESRLAQATQQIQDGKLLNATLGDQVEMQQEELTSLRALMALKEKKIEELEKMAKDTTESEALKQKLAALQEEVKKWEEDYERILYAYDFFRKRSEDWGPMYFEKERQWREAVQERVDCSRKIEAMEVDNRNLEEQVKRLEESLEQLSEEMKTSRRQQAADKEKTISDFEVRFSNLRLELEQEKSHSRELDVKLEAERETSAQRNAELNEKQVWAERKMKEIEKLEQQLADKRDQIAELENTVKNLEQMVERLQAACETQKATKVEAPKVQEVGFITNINHDTPTKASAMCSQPVSSGNLLDSPPLCSQEAPLFYDLSSPSPPEESRTINAATEPSVPASVRQLDPEWLRPPPAASHPKKAAATFDPYAFSQDSWNSNDSMGFTGSIAKHKKPCVSRYSAFVSVRKRANFDEKEECPVLPKVTCQVSPTKHLEYAAVNRGSKLCETNFGDTRGRGRGRASGRGRALSTGNGRARGRGRGIASGTAKFGGKVEELGKMVGSRIGSTDRKETSIKMTRSGRKSFPTINPRDLYASLVSSDSDFDD